MSQFFRKPLASWVVFRKHLPPWASFPVTLPSRGSFFSENCRNEPVFGKHRGHEPFFKPPSWSSLSVNLYHHEPVFRKHLSSWVCFFRKLAQRTGFFFGKLYRYEPVFSEISAVMSPFPETLPSWAIYSGNIYHHESVFPESPAAMNQFFGNIYLNESVFPETSAVITKLRSRYQHSVKTRSSVTHHSLCTRLPRVPVEGGSFVIPLIPSFRH